MSLTDQFLPSVQNLHLGGRRQMTNAASAEGSWIGPAIMDPNYKVLLASCLEVLFI
jgi:hypothetical protein